ncbi:hypothetical protein [Burkholderia cenocepacia]|uniref:hypothetical protein n=1 Tax=Burkholderia cenocepacia TaxID=95486 RepID=UPI002AB62B84|nr:hypothetical protein [Burkholderia cenocepacia]
MRFLESNSFRQPGAKVTQPSFAVAQNPVVEPEVGDVNFDFLKSTDPCHGKALDAAAKRLVLRPNGTERTGHSPKPR